jgi:hypothetical protein
VPVSPLVRCNRILDRRFPKEIMSSNVSIMEVKSHEELKFKEGNGILMRERVDNEIIKAFYLSILFIHISSAGCNGRNDEVDDINDYCIFED